MRKMEEAVLNHVKTLISQANNIVCVTGLGTLVESGGIDFWDLDHLCRIEKEYGDSPEELLSAGVYATKKEKFYNFYKKEVISTIPEPSETYAALKKLQDMDKLRATISLNICGFGISERASQCNRIPGDDL